MTRYNFQLLHLKYRDQVDAKEYIAYHLSDMFPYEKDKYYFDYRIKDKSLIVRYLCDQYESLELTKNNKKRKHLYKSFFKIIVLLIILLLNIFVLSNKKQFRQQFTKLKLIIKNKNDYLLNQAQSKKSKLAYNQRIALILRDLLRLPISIYHIRFDNSHFQISAYINHKDLEHSYLSIKKFIGTYKLNMSFEEYGQNILIWINSKNTI